VLAIVSFTMMTGYLVAKEMSPLQYLLETSPSGGGMGWSSSEFGLFAGARGFFNVFLLMLFFSGVILDKMGVRFTGILSCVLMLVGAGAIYGAVTMLSPEPTCNPTLLGISLLGGEVKVQVVVAALGFALFGIGYEMCGITVSKVIVKWFTGKEMALAMGLQVAMARLGTALALSCSPMIASSYGLSMPILLGGLSVGVGLIAYLVYCMMDRQGEAAGLLVSDVASAGDDEKFHLRDLLTTLRNPGFWLITLLCLFYYSALYPFLDFATKLMIAKYGVEPKFAGLIPAILPFGSIILTPLFGAMYDRRGHGATIMIVGSVMLTVVLAVFALPLNSSWIAITLMSILGIAFSLLPAALWPAVPKIVPMKQLGTAYSIIYYIQNIGLMVIPIWIGQVLAADTVGESVDYTRSLWIFTGIGICAIIVAVLLLAADRRNHYGLETVSRDES